MQGTFFSRNSFLKKRSKHFTCVKNVFTKGPNIILLNIICLMREKFFPQKYLPLKQFCSEISIDQNKIFLKSFCYWIFLTFINDPSITNWIFSSNLKLIPSYFLLYATVSKLEPVLALLIFI